MPYDVNGRGIDLDDGGMPMGPLLAILGVLAAAVVMRFCFDAGYGDGYDDGASSMEAPGYLVLDTSDADSMHAYGMPTAEDVEAYRRDQQWGFMWGGRMLVYDSLPGSGKAWEMLYGYGG